MDENDILKYLKKKVYFVVKSNSYNFTGTIISISKGSFILIDKFNKELVFDISDISYMNEVDDV